jgi:hypothetical protein
VKPINDRPTDRPDSRFSDTMLPADFPGFEEVEEGIGLKLALLAILIFSCGVLYGALLITLTN